MTQPAPASRRAPDLARDEAAVAAWFRGAARAAAPGADSILRAPARPLTLRHGTLRHGHPTRALLAPFAAAAALLLALVPPAGAPSRAAGEPRVGERAPVAVSSTVLVIDDPSVPSLHALDTFEQLAWMSRAADGPQDVGNVR